MSNPSSNHLLRIKSNLSANTSSFWNTYSTHSLTLAFPSLLFPCMGFWDCCVFLGLWRLCRNFECYTSKNINWRQLAGFCTKIKLNPTDCVLSMALTDFIRNAHMDAHNRVNLHELFLYSCIGYCQRNIIICNHCNLCGWHMIINVF